jgi:hypothetical protein
MKLKTLYLIWAFLVIILVLIKSGLTNDNITHIWILLYLGLSLFVFHRMQKNKDIAIKNPKRFFILYCVIGASIVEGFYMITSPVLPSLLITAKLTFAEGLRNYLIDLAFTVPAYFVIFNVVWRIINKYKYSVWEYVFFISLGQAFGDGSRTFIFQPALLLFIPYVMLNYQAMNVTPFLYIKNTLSTTVDSKKKYLYPLIVIPLTYLACGVVIYTAAALFKIK